jgi:dienelactone hydrolase
MIRPALALAVCLVAPGAALPAERPVQLRASDGTMLTATLYEAATTPAPAVVLVHMLTRTKEDWGRFAGRLQASGATALALDLRGHGGSAGSAAPSAAMALDVQAAVAWLGTRNEVRPGAIVVVGASLGASLAVLAAAESQTVRGVALLSPATEYRGVRLEPGLRGYGERPMLVVASSEDPYALRSARALVSAEAPERELLVSPVPAHGSHLADRDPSVAASLLDWLRRTLVF